jgi:hypothetical protein
VVEGNKGRRKAAAERGGMGWRKGKSAYCVHETKTKSEREMGGERGITFLPRASGGLVSPRGGPDGTAPGNGMRASGKRKYSAGCMTTVPDAAGPHSRGGGPRAAWVVMKIRASPPRDTYNRSNKSEDGSPGPQQLIRSGRASLVPSSWVASLLRTNVRPSSLTHFN